MMLLCHNGSSGCRLPIAGILNPPDELENRSWSEYRPNVATPSSVPLDSHQYQRLPQLSRPSSGSNWELRENSPASTSSSSHESDSPRCEAQPYASSPNLGPYQGPKRKHVLDDDDSSVRSFHHGPPTPPDDEPMISYKFEVPSRPLGLAPPHPMSKTGRPCSCEACKTHRSGAHAVAADRYRRTMVQLISRMGNNQVSPSVATRLADICEELATSDEPAESMAGSFSSPLSGSYSLSKKEAHKHKEKSRRDTQKSFLLTLSALTPAPFQPCTSHRHAKNNVEEPAHMTTLDRAALYVATQRLALDRLVREGRLNGQEIADVMAEELQHGVCIVRDMVSQSESFVGECRGFGVLNVGMEMEDWDTSNLSEHRLSGTNAATRPRSGGSTGHAKAYKKKDAGKRRRGA